MTLTKRIAITTGEPAGIGAEAVVRALAMDPCPGWDILLVGPRTVWQRAQLVAEAGLPENCAILEPGSTLPFDWEWGKVTPQTAGAALEAVKAATSLALEGAVSAIVTAPLTKEGLSLAGCEAPGHTEFLGRMCQAEPHMFFTAPGMKVILVTTHLPLSAVSGAISRERVLATIRAAHQGLACDFGVENPRIAVTGLNPHAGENGRLGREEGEMIAPAIRDAIEEGIDARGPYPADALFSRLGQNEFDVIAAMYHDQGLGPFKMAHFHDGVNVTLGLPIVRTSPDHGTALDIAGRGLAQGLSTAEAVRTAVGIARRRAEIKICAR